MRKAPTVELVYDNDCPNVGHARAAIRDALRELGADPVWTEWDRESLDTPADRRRYASPTVLVDGHDVGRDDPSDLTSDAKACRVYIDEEGCVCRAPSSRVIVAAITATAKP